MKRHLLRLMRSCVSLPLSIAACLLSAHVSSTHAQKIDFDLSNRNNTANGYVGWAIDKCTSTSKTFTSSAGNEVTVSLSAESSVDAVLKSNWHKNSIQNNELVIGDIVGVYGVEGDNTPQLTDVSATLNISISGLSAGENHALLFLNQTDGLAKSAPVDILVDGIVVKSGLEMPCRASKISECCYAFLTFNVAEGATVKISIVSKPASGETYNTTGVFLCALDLETENDPATTTQDPYPGDYEMHADGDAGYVRLSWNKAYASVVDHVFIGESEDEMPEVGTSTTGSYKFENPNSLKTYYWRVDGEDANGNTFKGNTWQFQVRHDAFPGAEGYGRYAKGGRGGSVYHVTSLEDDPEDIKEGTLRYGLTVAKGPRTIVFDVSGVIALKARLTCGDPYVTIAGQTAPGKGILIRNAPLGSGGGETIIRFVRSRRGHISAEAPEGIGIDGLGLMGNNSIMDHCSVGWTIDEAFSSRGCKNITLQRTLISEALNVAGHPNYSAGTAHGYAATIGGDTASYHHNLLVHNEGRNWSMSGALDGSGNYAGHHDMFNNVCYNWGGRATDGGTHEGNFVNNYYKMGPATTKTVLLQADLEGTGTGTQSYYVSGNIRESTSGAQTTDKNGDTYTYRATNGQVVNWTPFVSAPFFASKANIETAKAAYKNVLCDAGCNMPAMDDHDKRMVRETLTGTTSTVGSKSGKKGLIDSEEDNGYGFSWYTDTDNFPAESRPENWDTDQDGMPDWWENARGLNASTADNNEDPDGDGYTNLEDYLNWLAEPHFRIKAGEEVSMDISALFAGYDNNAKFSTNFSDGNVTASIDGGTLTIKSTESTDNFFCVPVSATDDDNWGTLTRNVNFYISNNGESDVVPAPISNALRANTIDNIKATGVYSISGIRIRKNAHTQGLTPGLYLIRYSDGSSEKYISK